MEIAGRIGELGEDDDLLPRKFFRLQKPDEFLQLVVVLRLELPRLLEELHDLVKIEHGLIHHLDNVVLVAIKPLHGVQKLRRGDVLVRILFLSISPVLELALACVSEDVGVLVLPAFQPPLLRFGLAVHRDEGKEFLQQAVAGKLKGTNRTLKPLQELGPNQGDHLPLTTFYEGIDTRVRSLVPSQGVVNGQCEERFFLGKRLLELVEELAVSLSDRVCGHLRRLAFRKNGCGSGFTDLAFPCVCPAALHYELPKGFIRRQELLCLDQVLGQVLNVTVNEFAEGSLQVIEVGTQVVHAERSGEIRLVPPCEKFGHVPEVAQAVVDRGGREHVQCFPTHSSVE